MANKVRALMAGLDDSDLRGLVSSVPGLAFAWAPLAKVGAEALDAGQARALRAVRVHMARRPEAFYRALGNMAALVPDLASLLSAELTEVAMSAASDCGDALAQERPRGTLPHDSLSEDGPSSGAESEVDQLLEQVDRLNAEAQGLAEDLRTAADVVKRGLLPSADLTQRLGQWMAELVALGTACEADVAIDGLGTVRQLLVERATHRDARRTELVKLVRGVDALASQGLDDLARSLLQQAGFAEKSDVVRELDALGGESYVGKPKQEESVETAEEVLAEGPTPAAQDPAPIDAAPLDEPDGMKSPHVDEPEGPEPPRVEEPEGPHPPQVEVEDGEPSHVEVKVVEVSAVEVDVVEASAVGEEGVALSADPWTQGQPPAIAELVVQGREAVAYHVAAAADEPAMRLQLLRYLVAAFHCDAEHLAAELPDLALSQDQTAELGADELRVLIAANLRAALALGYLPTGAIDGLIDEAQLGEEPLDRLLRQTAALARDGYRHESGDAQHEVAEFPARWTDMARRAHSIQGELESKRTILQRASKIVHHLARRDQPLGSALADVQLLANEGLAAANETESWAALEQAARDLAHAKHRQTLIDDADRAVSTRGQLTKKLVGTARSSIDGEIQEVARFVAAFLSLRQEVRAARVGSTPNTTELSMTLKDLPDHLPAGTVGEAALARLVAWIRGGDSELLVPYNVDHVLTEAVMPLFELPRDGDGVPRRQVTPDEAETLVRGRDPLTAIRGYLAVGNIEAAYAVLVAEDVERGDALDDEVAVAIHAAQRGHAQAVARVERIAARLSSLNEDDLARDIVQRLDQVRVPVERRFDLSADPLATIEESGRARLEEVRTRLRERIATLGQAEERARITQLVGSDDEALAIEFLTMVESGIELPRMEPPAGDDFAGFFPGLVRVASAAMVQGESPTDAVRADVGVPHRPTDRILSSGLEAWEDLRRHRRGGDWGGFFRRLAQIMRMLGLAPRPDQWVREITKMKRTGYANFVVMATPIDRSYVPAFGTQAHGSYDVTVVWDTVRPQRLLELVPDTRHTAANIILYFGALDVDERLELRRLTIPGRGKGFSPLVIDEAVVGWLSTQLEPGWRLTQRVTLPFTTLTPYAPFAGGEVPDEVFVGRQSERQQIVSPTGSMFVYGGRQLGKSALLRKVERTFTDPLPEGFDPRRDLRSGNLAVYIDLKAAAIGSALEPAELWPAIAQRLEVAGVFRQNRPQRRTEDQVVKAIASWLDAEPTNRLLLLLDEADDFLTADAASGRRGNAGGFPTLQSLKGLMERSQRRFKPVFAGLHQVQRFHDMSNTPVAHGGQDILIGQLRPQDARHLVRDPMFALGYEFESQETIWRLLLSTNYQASLVQIVCEALVKHMQPKPLPNAGGRVMITSDDIDLVYAKREVRDLIAQRFRWTINLDSRYRVIALVVALRSLDAAPGETFSAEDLQEECEVFWPTGFAGDVLSSKEFGRYLIEMEGLGVLHRQGDRYGLRSPNIIGLLGSREALNRELDEAPQVLELAYEYNPTMNRRIIGPSAELWAERSPMSDSDLVALVAPRTDSPVIAVVGSKALGMGRVAAAIAMVVRERGAEFKTVTPDLIPMLSGRRGRSPLHVVVDLSDPAWAGREVAEVCDLLSRKRNLLSTVLLSPQHVAADADLGLDLPTTYLRRWTVEGLRSWQESPFSTPALRQNLHNVTSGWPRLVEDAMRRIQEGATPTEALHSVASRLARPNPQTLAESGVPPAIASAWATWFSKPAEDGLLDPSQATLADLQVALGIDDVAAVVDRLERLDVVGRRGDTYFLDRVVLNAAVPEP